MSWWQQRQRKQFFLASSLVIPKRPFLFPWEIRKQLTILWQVHCRARGISSELLGYDNEYKQGILTD